MSGAQGERKGEIEKKLDMFKDTVSASTPFGLGYHSAIITAKEVVAEAKRDFPTTFFVANDRERMQLLEEWADRIMDWHEKWFEGGSAPPTNIARGPGEMPIGEVKKWVKPPTKEEELKE